MLSSRPFGGKYPELDPEIRLTPTHFTLTNKNYSDWEDVNIVIAPINIPKEIRQSIFTPKHFVEGKHYEFALPSLKAGETATIARTEFKYYGSTFPASKRIYYIQMSAKGDFERGTGFWFCYDVKTDEFGVVQSKGFPKRS